MNLQEFKNELKKLVAESDIRNTLTILNELLRQEVEKFNMFIALQGRYNTIDRRFNTGQVTTEQWQVIVSQVVHSLPELIDEIQEGELVDGWENAQLFEVLGDDADEVDDSEPVIEIPQSRINLPDSEGVDEKEKQEFKRLMMKCQDALAIDEYEDAYRLCEKAKNDIEPESVQVYEYLLMTYFKKENTGEIIENALTGDGKKLKHIILYTKRYKEFWKEGFSQAGFENIKEISNHLTSNLKQKYLNLKEDYIVDGESSISREVRSYVENCIKIFLLIHSEMYPTTIFFESAIDELSGGGKLSWLTLNENRNLESRYTYNALLRRENLIELFDESNAQSKPKLSTSLYYKLVKRYNGIEPYEDENTGARFWRDEKRQAIVRYIEASKIAFSLYGEGRFLRYPIEELSGKRKLYWFELTEDGELKNNEFCERIDYNALEDLEILVEKSSEDSYRHVYEELRRNVADKLNRDTQIEYRRIRQEIARNQDEVENLEYRARIIQCLKNWELCFKIIPDHRLIDLCVEELVGEGIMYWFQLLATGELKANAGCRNLGYEPLIEVKRLNDLNMPGNPLSEYDLEKRITQNFFNKTKQRYDNIVPGEDNIITQRAVIADCIHRFESYYKAYHDASFLQPAIEELNNRGKFKWTYKFIFWQLNVSECRKLDFNAVRELQNLEEMIHSEIRSER